MVISYYLLATLIILLNKTRECIHLFKDNRYNKFYCLFDVKLVHGIYQSNSDTCLIIILLYYVIIIKRVPIISIYVSKVPICDMYVRNIVHNTT